MPQDCDNIPEYVRSMFSDPANQQALRRACAGLVEPCPDCAALRAQLAEEEKYTNKYIRHLHGAEKERDTLRARLEEVRAFLRQLTDCPPKSLQPWASARAEVLLKAIVTERD
jgi:hypothetical protein